MAIVTLAEVKTHLNITSSTNDTELGQFSTRAEAAMIRRVREVEPTSKTVRVDGGGRRGLCLPTGQAIASVTSVTPVGGAALDMATLFVKASSGVIEYNLGGCFTARAYDVAYMAGFTVTPEDLKLATLELVRHFWETQRGGSVRPGSRPSESLSNTIPGAAHALPFRVTELLAPWLRTAVA